MSDAAPRDGDFGYTDTYDDDDDDAQQTPQRTARDDGGGDDDDDADDTELAAMFAKVQTIQQAEGIQVKLPVGRAQPYDLLEVSIPERAATQRKRSTSIPTSGKSSGSSSSRTVSPVGSRVGTATTTRSPDGITTISRRALVTGHAGGGQMDVLAGMKKPSLFQDRLLQTAKQQPQALEQLKQKVVAAAPAVIAKRVATLSEPKNNDTGRKFAQDDDEKHCRFRVKKNANGSGGGGRDAYEDDESGRDRTSDFLARMEATERNKQKKLELTRGEKDYLANLNKKVCPKCDVPQSYSEHRDKKKRCQTCGSEFRVPQAWGDIGAEFIGRISEDSRTREERKQQIRTQVIQQEVAANRVAKSATQQLYEKTLQQRNEHKTFLDRNYTAAKAAPVGGSSSNAKTKQAQLHLQMQLQAQRAKLLAAAQPPIY